MTLKIAVLLPVYNTCSIFLKDSIESILEQIPSEKNPYRYRIFLCNDGSDCKQTLSAISYYHEKLDPSIFLVIDLIHNQGICKALNLLIEAALDWGADYMARMDSDDIAVPDRFLRQVEFLVAHNEIHVLGGIAQTKNNSESKKYIEHSVDSCLVHLNMFFNCSLVHPTVMIRSSVFSQFISKVDGTYVPQFRYDSEFEYAEDYALWLQMIIESVDIRISNLPHPPILLLRKHDNNQSKKFKQKQIQSTFKAITQAIINISQRIGVTYDGDLGILPETISGMVMGDFFNNVEAVRQAFSIVIALEKYMLSSFLSVNCENSRKESVSISEECKKRLGELACLDLKFSNTDSPSSLKTWKFWINRLSLGELKLVLGNFMINEPQKMHLSSCNSATTIQMNLIENLHLANSIDPSPDDDGLISIIVFSKNRAYQLGQYLRTLKMFALTRTLSSRITVNVIWKADNKKFLKSYYSLVEHHPDVNWIQEKEFSSQLKALIKKAHRFILWAVDDVIFYRHIDLVSVCHILSISSFILCAHLRLSPNIAFSHPLNSKIQLPPFSDIANAPDLLLFDRSKGTGDWDYPFDLSSTIMHKADVVEIIEKAQKLYGIQSLYGPNQFEVCGSRIFSKYLHSKSATTTCICLKTQALCIITVNRIQDVCKNRIYNEITVEEMEKYFEEDIDIDLNYYQKAHFDAAHVGDFVLETAKTIDCISKDD